MKQFKKNEQGLFICEECNNVFTCRENLSKHIKHHNMSIKDYNNKWIKEPGDGICHECGKETKSIEQIYCSIECKRIGASKTKSLNAKIKNQQEKNKREEKYKFICNECNEKFETSIKFSNHIIKNHRKKEYYDKWLKKENEGLCKICNKETDFTGRFNMGYMLCCSKKCSDEYRFIKRSKINLKKYGVENPFQSETTKQKTKQTCLEKYGVDHPMKCEKGKEEWRAGNRKKYGVDCVLSLPSVIEKRRLSNLENYGVENVFQRDDIFIKTQKTRFVLKQFRNTNINYRGTYELDFLEKYYDKYLDIENAPTIRYNKNKVYFPDFYIPSLNLIIEIKNSYLAKKDKNKIIAKKKATIAKGFKYIMIIDKNYDKFNNWVKF